MNIHSTSQIPQDFEGEAVSLVRSLFALPLRVYSTARLSAVAGAADGDCAGNCSGGPDRAEEGGFACTATAPLWGSTPLADESVGTTCNADFVAPGDCAGGR